MATLRALEVLVAIAEAGSLTAAAEALNLSQPALSHQVRSLEREVGASVVDRLPRGVRLTAVGAAMLESARLGADAAHRAVALGRAVADGEAGVLRVASAESMTAGLLAPAFATWRRTHPDVGIELSEHASADRLVQELLDGATDLAVGPRPSGGDVELRLLGREEVVLVCGPDHRLAGRTDATLAEAAAEPFVHLTRSNGLAGWLDAVLAAAGVTTTPVVRVRSAATAAALAGAGLGVAVVPRSATSELGAGVVVPLDPPLARDVVAMHRLPVQPLVAQFCEIVRSVAPLSDGAGPPGRRRAGPHRPR